MPPSRELYVYYHVDPDKVDPARRAIRALQRSLVAAHPGLTARFLQKQTVAGVAPVWMEIYTAPGGVNPDLETAIVTAAEAVMHLLRGGRHLEFFLADAG
jgi:hypothetical protein